MYIRREQNHIIIRLEKGELLVESLEEIARSEAIKGGFFYGLGGLAWAELGFYQLENKQYNFKRFDELMELANITGNIAIKDGEVMIHNHATLGRADYSSLAGHLKEAEVAGTVEIIVDLTDQLTRSHNAEVGLPLLDL